MDKPPQSLKGRSETRMYAAGIIHFQVPGDGDGGRPFGSQPFSLSRRNPVTSSR